MCILGLEPCRMGHHFRHGISLLCHARRDRGDWETHTMCSTREFHLLYHSNPQ